MIGPRGRISACPRSKPSFKRAEVMPTDSRMATKLKIISKADAIKRGFKRFFSGVPCKKGGHVVEQYTCNGACVECQNLRLKVYFKTPKGKQAQRRASQSPLGKESRRQYAESPLGKERYRRIHESTSFGPPAAFGFPILAHQASTGFPTSDSRAIDVVRRRSPAIPP
jgi:hypothetical protein